MEYLFICGCPRSGTTALWRQMASHKNLAIGVERFILKANTSFSLTPDLFSKKRFFDYQKNDTHFPNITEGLPGKYYKSISNSFDEMAYIGDKIPVLYRHYIELFKKFPHAKIIFIFRNIFDVAQSYKVRLENKEDPWKKNVIDAVHDWNQSLQNTLDILKTKQSSFLLVEYEKLFFDKNTQTDFSLALSNFLKLDITQEFNNNLKNQISQALNLDKKRVLNLTTHEKREIMHNADFHSYKKLLTLMNS